MLSRRARELAAEIKSHDWSDSPYRVDRAGHQRRFDGKKKSSEVLTVEETDRLRTNVMLITAQVLKYEDPNLDLHEYAAACGVPRSITHRANGTPSDAIKYGLRWDDDEATVPSAPGAPLWLISLWCEVPDVRVFKRLLLRTDGLDPSLRPVIESLGDLHKVVVAVRDWEEKEAAEGAVKLVSAASAAVLNGKPAELIGIQRL